MKLQQCLITTEDFDKIDEIEVLGYDPEGNEIKKADGSRDFITVGIRSKSGITWREMKKLGDKYYDLNIDESKGEGKSRLTFSKGDAKRFLMFVKWYKDDSGIQQDFKQTELEALAPKMVQQIEVHLPSKKDIMSSIESSRKKKSTGSLRKRKRS